MPGPSLAAGSRPLPDWGPADLAAALAPGPVAVLDGLAAAGRPCTLVAWAPAVNASSLEQALALAAPVTLPPDVPPLLGAVVGTLNWDGAADFWLPGAAVLFDPGAERLWYRGELPLVQFPTPPAAPAGHDPGGGSVRARAGWSRAGFCVAVAEAQRRMAAGALHKVILSVPFTAPCTLTPVDVYRRLTAGGPPGLRFLLNSGCSGRVLAGVSPELLVTLAGRRAELHPLAGTRPASAGMAEELLSSGKDRAEHTVAVAQATRDLQSVCRPRTVQTESFMALERHPGLVHLASHLTGSLRHDAGPAELVRACFPAGTVSGVPREAAMALIRDLEPQPRCWYAGAVGALLPGGDLQLWLTIRSLCLTDGEATVQTGAGIVPQSSPEAEWAECQAKARRTLAAIGAEVATDEP